MIAIDISSMKDLNYSVCEYLLRNRIHDVVIHCPSTAIVENLSIYMVEIGIPWSVDSILPGISITNHMDLSLPKLHICIFLSKEFPILLQAPNHVTTFLVHDTNQEKIATLETSSASFDLNLVPIHLQNEEIRKMFLRAFILAEKEIDIISPWMNFSVVNNSLINLMKQALQRGVMIRIIYGLLPNADEYNQLRSDRSDQVANRLKEVFSDYGEAFKISRDNIHYKLVLCDEKFKLEGGFNYLSFTGDYTNPNTRREGSPFGRDAAEIRYLRKEYFCNDSME